MFSSTVRRTAAETVGESVPVDPAELVPLAELAGEGFGWGGQFVKSPGDAVDVLAAQLAGEVVLDDLGRRCVTRDTARALFAERAEAERLGRAAQERRQAELAELAERNRPRGGVPIPDGLGDVDAVAVLRQAEIEAKRDAKGTQLDELFAGGLTFHRVGQEDES